MAELTDSERNERAALAAGGRIVTAVGVAVGRAFISTEAADRIESAMLQAAREAQREGLSDSEVRQRIIEARDREIP